MEKSAFKTTLAHGPGQPVGGKNVKNLGEKLLKAMLLKRSATHGTVSGRDTGGSAVAVLPDPITSPGDGIGCAERTDALNKNEAMIAVPTIDLKKRWGKGERDRTTLMGGLRQAGTILAAGLVQSQIERHIIRCHNRSDSPATTNHPEIAAEDHETSCLVNLVSEVK
jgi:hypothetical protein